ncbi:MAG: MBL fold metallo-hydrolase [Myxococcota bacterium]
MSQAIVAVWASIVASAAVSEPSPEVVKDVIATAKQAYGGTKLERLRSVSIYSDRRLAWAGQGQTAAFVEFAVDKMIKHFDLKRRHGSVERWIRQTGNVYHNRYVVNAGGGMTLDYMEGTKTTTDNATYWASFAPDYRVSDLLLAHYLATQAPKVTSVGSAYYDGREHHVVSFRISPQSPVLNVYVAKDDGLIRRVSMQRSFGPVTIIFASHSQTQGLRYARENRAFLGDTLVEYEYGLVLRANRKLGPQFRVSSRLKAPPERVDMSNMTVDALAPKVYMVGQSDYSMFVEHGDRYIAVNSYPGLKARYEALVAHTKRDFPLADVVVTHHHSDHMDGISEAAELGATLHVTEQTMQVLKKSATSTTAPIHKIGSIRILTDGDALGPLSLYVRPTPHAVENVFAYHADQHILYQDDHYHGQNKTRFSRVQPTAYALHEVIGRLGLKVDFLLSGHARKAERWSDFEKALAQMKRDPVCPSRRRICRDI